MRKEENESYAGGEESSLEKTKRWLNEPRKVFDEKEHAESVFWFAKACEIASVESEILKTELWAPQDFDQEERIKAKLAGLRAKLALLNTEMGSKDLTLGPDTAQVAVSAGNTNTPDPKRRLDLLRALGGTVKYKNNEWRFTGMTALVASEKSAGRKRSDQKTIRADLREAAEDERDAKRAGFADGLGQR